MMASSFASLFSLHFSLGKDSREVDVLFGPAMTIDQVIRHLAPLQIQFQLVGAFESIVVLSLINSNQIDKIYGAGARLVLDAIFSGGCLTATQNENTKIIGEL